MTADQQIDFLVNSGIPHTIKLCPNSTIIKTEKKTYHIPNAERIDTKYLNFIKETKHEVCDNSERLNLKKCRPEYFEFKLTKDRSVVNCVEIDINSAYWQTAYKVGLITETTYLKGLQVPKEIRLMAFGSAATLRDCFVFDGVEYTDVYIETNEWGRIAFFHVSKIVSELIQRILDKIPGVFAIYWVDAIFIREWYKQYVTDELEASGYSYKIKDIPRINVSVSKGPGLPDVVTCFVKISENENFCEFEIKKFKKHKKNNKKTREKIIKNPIFAAIFNKNLKNG